MARDERERGGSQGRAQNTATNVGQQKVALRIQPPDNLTAAAAELTRRIDEINKCIDSVEKAKVVTQQLLQKEVSI